MNGLHVSADTVVLAISAVAFLYSIIAHEVAHGWVARLCGDDTAYLMGRLTANPLPHVDPVLSILLPFLSWYSTGIPFGGAKPVPVNFVRLKRWKLGWVLVGLAGIAANLAIALACVGLFHAGSRMQGRTDTIGHLVFQRVALANLGLALFNLIPIPPFDGSRAARFLIGDLRLRQGYDRLEPYGMFVVLVLLNVTPLGFWLLSIELDAGRLLGIVR